MSVSSRRGRRRPRLHPVIVAVLCAAVAGCGSGSVPDAAPSPPVTSAAAPSRLPLPPSASPSPTPVVRRAPLTGRPLAGAAASAARPAVVVKIENSAAARPQSGLGAADLVVEQLVEGGATRFAAFYQSADPGTVGPVRSVRNVDAAIAGPTRGVLAFSGGAKVVLRVVARADVQLVAPGDVRGAFRRSSARRAPHNLLLDVSRIWGQTSAAHSRPPARYLPFGPLAPGVATAPATRATLRFSAGSRPVWTYDVGSRQWRRSESGGSPAVGADGARLVADNVLVLRVRVRDAGYRDPAGNPVPESVFVGSGDATLLVQGRAVRGRWAKPSAAASLRLVTAAGVPMTVPPGRTWIELLPTGGSLAVTR